MLQCMAARCLRQSGADSEAFTPIRSVVQGLRSGTRFAKAVTYFIMQKIATIHARLLHRLWIDDLSQ
eukprot:9350353-Pyramimonas_sp.AAC.1